MRQAVCQPITTDVNQNQCKSELKKKIKRLRYPTLVPHIENVTQHVTILLLL
jgi:hypothetical protein